MTHSTVAFLGLVAVTTAILAPGLTYPLDPVPGAGTLVRPRRMNVHLDGALTSGVTAPGRKEFVVAVTVPRLPAPGVDRLRAATLSD